jgi:hypothetical protein
MKIVANIAKRVNSQNNQAFLAVTGTIVGDDTQSVEFNVNGVDAVEELSAVADSFRAGALLPVLELSGDVQVNGKPEIVTVDGVARAKTWANRPVHSVRGSFEYTVVDAEPIPAPKASASLLENATAILKARGH